MSVTLSEYLSRIDKTVVSESMVSLPMGRGYHLGGQYTDDSVHIAAVVSSFLFQGQLLRDFSHAVNRAPMPDPDLYIGIGGLMNLTYIAALKPKAAILIDINPMQTLFWRQITDDIVDHKKTCSLQKVVPNI